MNQFVWRTAVSITSAARVGLAVYCVLGATGVVARETGTFQPPDIEKFLLINGEDADGDGDGVKETHIVHYRNVAGAQVFSMTTKGKLWAWSMETAGQDEVESGWNFVIRDSDCDGVFDEKYRLDEEFRVPDCLK